MKEFRHSFKRAFLAGTSLLAGLGFALLPPASQAAATQTAKKPGTLTASAPCLPLLRYLMQGVRSALPTCPPTALLAKGWFRLQKKSFCLRANPRKAAGLLWHGRMVQPGWLTIVLRPVTRGPSETAPICPRG